MLATASAAMVAAAYVQMTGNESGVAQAAPAQSPQPGQRLPPEGMVGTNYERTFIAIKPGQQSTAQPALTAPPAQPSADSLCLRSICPAQTAFSAV